MSSASTFIFAFLALALCFVSIDAKLCFRDTSQCPINCEKCSEFSNGQTSVSCCDSENFSLANQFNTNPVEICYEDATACDNAYGNCQSFTRKSDSKNVYCFAPQVKATAFLAKAAAPMALAQNVTSANQTQPLNSGVECIGQCYSNSDVCTEACTSCNPCGDRFCCVM